jgi:hypothetical protein
LRDFIQLCFSENLSDFRDARVAKGREFGSVLIRAIDHGAKLEDSESPAVLPDPALAEKDGAA